VLLLLLLLLLLRSPSFFMRKIGMQSICQR
jgi:hypothetical protein